MVPAEPPRALADIGGKGRLRSLELTLRSENGQRVALRTGQNDSPLFYAQSIALDWFARGRNSWTRPSTGHRLAVPGGNTDEHGQADNRPLHNDITSPACKRAPITSERQTASTELLHVHHNTHTMYWYWLFERIALF